jgi:hypothetical protein
VPNIYYLNKSNSKTKGKPTDLGLYCYDSEGEKVGNMLALKNAVKISEIA